MTSTHVIRPRTLRDVMTKALYVALAAFAFVFVLIVISGIHP